jgi:hypothetical protein
MSSARWLVAAGLLAIATSVDSITLGFEPANHTVAPGSPISVELVISGLAGSAAPSLGAFELDVLYDPAILRVTGVTFGDPVLGGQLDLFGLGSLSGFDDSAPGTLGLFETSLDLPDDLDALQADGFTLATLSFDALAAGASSLTIDTASLLLGDALGDPLAADSMNSGNVTVIPEPAPAALALIGLLLLARVRRSFEGTHLPRPTA